MNLLVQSNILGDTIESSPLHMGDSSETLFDGEEPGLLFRDHSFTRMVAMRTRQASIHHKDTQKERGFKTRENKRVKGQRDCFMTGDRESLNIRYIVNTVLLRCKGGMS